MREGELKKLLQEYQTGSIKTDDLVTLLDYIALGQNEELIDRLLAELMEEMKEDPALPIASESLYERITAHPQFQSTPITSLRYYYYRWVAAVAAVFIMVGAAWWFISPHADDWSIDEIQYTARTVTTAPTDKLLLKTSGGEIIDLDNLTTNETSGIPTIQFAGQEGLIYGKTGQEDIQEEHTIITPKGRQYHLVLSDGTKVWLNSATTITFPARFNKNKRQVKLDGEAYFEVEKAAQWPFVVHASTQAIEVLGTHFNINSYNEDKITYTTLLEGKVSISAAGNSTILYPGQQAKNTTHSSTLEITRIEAKDAIAWKDNIFLFHNEEIQQAMRQVSRWYDVEVVYLNGMEGKRIGGSVSRFEKITELMNALQATGLLHYEMKGGTIIIKE